MSENENLRIYEAVRSVPQEALKPFKKDGFDGLDINPMWRIKKLTEMFGACGFGWYTEITRMDTIAVDNDIITVVNINLYVKQDGKWSKPIFGTGGNKIKATFASGKNKLTDEGFKMAYTDAIGVACKALGIGADVYFENDKSSKYSVFYNDAQKDAKEAPAKMATQAQKNVVLALPETDEIRIGAIKSFGENLENMTAQQAAAVFNRLNKRKA